MAFRPTNNQNEAVLSISGSKQKGRRKNGPSKRAVKCQCSKCGDIAMIVDVGIEHMFCRGFKINKPLPGVFRNLIGKTKGKWELWQEPAIEAAAPIESNSEQTVPNDKTC